MRIHKIIVTGCLILLLSQFWLKGFELNHTTPYKKDRQPKNPPVEDILLHLAQYCDKFADSVLFYRCNEEIEEIIYTPPRFVNFQGMFRGQVKKNRFVYDYQLIRKEGKIHEQRILIEENSKKRNYPNAPLKVKRMPYRHLISGPIGLFGRYWQQYYDYKIVGDNKIHGEKAVIINVTPKPSHESEYLYGKAWVRKSDFSVLKIEYSQESIRDFEFFRDSAKMSNLAPDFTIVTEFAFEKNSIRFPSWCSLSENYADIDKPKWKYNKSQVKVTYSDYQFFTVEIEVK